MNVPVKKPPPTEPSEATSGVFQVVRRSQGTNMEFALHDAKNMVCALVTDVEWLRTTCESHTHSEIAHALAEVEDACRTLGGILLGALRAERAGDDSIIVNRRPTSLSGLLHAAARSVRHRAERAGIRIEVASELPVSGEVDPDLIRRVIDNLIDNALTVSSPGSAITLHAGAYGDSVVVSVSDQGPGIDETRGEDIFSLHVSAPDSPGVGVGLAFCRQVAEAHGGHLVVDSTPGDGATFLLSLPLTGSIWAE